MRVLGAEDLTENWAEDLLYKCDWKRSLKCGGESPATEKRRVCRREGEQALWGDELTSFVSCFFRHLCFDDAAQST